MRLVLIALFCAAAIWILVAGFRNKKRISWLGIILMLIPAGGLTYFEYQWQQTQNKISLVVQDISGKKDTGFKCERLSFGFFDASADKRVIDSNDKVVELKYAECNTLLDWYKETDKSKPTEEQIVALHLFDQQVMRVSGQPNADLEECLAIKNYSAIAQKLGATPSQGDYMSLYYQQRIGASYSDPAKRPYC